MATDNIQKLVIKSELETIAEARHWVTKHLQNAKFGAEDIFGIELVVGEALANMVEHSYKGKKGQEIHLALTIDDAKLQLQIRDFGQKFEPTDYTPPNLDNPSEAGGYGVYLIHEIMDEVHYNTTLPQGTELTLVKYRPGAKPS
jgi:anti-sigma regulatory factor (Ser/Thr protein kinase)